MLKKSLSQMLSGLSSLWRSVLGWFLVICKSVRSKIMPKADTSQVERSRSKVCEIWDEFIAWCARAVLAVDNVAHKLYTLFRKVTPDRWEPYVRFCAYVYIFFSLIFIYHVASKPESLNAKSADLFGISIFGNPKPEVCSSDVYSLRAIVGQKNRHLKRCTVELSRSLAAYDVLEGKHNNMRLHLKTKPKVSASKVYKKKRKYKYRKKKAVYVPPPKTWGGP